MNQRPALAPLGLVAPLADTAGDERQRRLHWAVWSSGKTLWEWQAQHGGFLVEHRQPAGDGMAPAGDLPDVVVRTEHLDWDAFVARLHPQDRARFQLAWRQHLAGQRPDIDLTLRAAESDPSAAPCWWRLRGRALGRDATGQVARVLGTVKDVSAERGAQVSLRRLAHAFASTREALALVDADGAVLEANAALQRLCGSPPLTPGSPLPPWLDDATPLPALLAEVLFLGAWQGERQWRGAAGPVPVAVSITPVDAADGEPPCFLVALTDQRERLAAQQRLLHTAMTDQVTLLPNRLAAEAKGEALFSQPGPLPPEVALLFIDLDGFKDLNESYGHAFGDALLAEVGHRLRLALGATATLARWNADVFAVLLPPGSGDTDVRAAAQLALAALAEPLQVQSQALTVVATLGAALAPQHGSDFNTLVRKAELAVHAAKDTGRNFVVFEPELDHAVQRRVRMTGLLRIDADRNAFHFVAQPKVDADGLPVGVELLMRWTTEAFGAVSPVEFIPLAERVGLIQMMGRHAAQAAAQLAAASVAAGHHLPVAVNLAALQLQQPGLDSLLLQACRRHGVSPTMIELELTESALVHSLDQVAPVLHRLRSHGFSVALDDFGTGYSSLGYLRHLPFDKVKIDRSFVLDIDRDTTAVQVLASIVQLCEALGMRVVAEGVETLAQSQVLRALGVHEFQGFHFARPLALADWLALLHRHPAGSLRLPLNTP